MSIVSAMPDGAAAIAVRAVAWIDVRLALPISDVQKTRGLPPVFGLALVTMECDHLQSLLTNQSHRPLILNLHSRRLY